MSGYIGPKDKVARRLGVNLWGRTKNPIASSKKKRHMAPRKKSEYGIRLNEKQKLRYFYGGIRERKFRFYYQEAKRRGENVGVSFLQLLERRLDVVVYRMNLTPTIFSARQLASHGHILVNGNRVNIPSYLLSPDDVIEVRPKSKGMALIHGHLDNPERTLSANLSFERDKLRGVYERLPEKSEIIYPFEFNEALIIEFYSK